MDGGGLSTIGTIQVSVISGPNLRPPSFAKELYEINVSEAAAPGSLVYSFHVIQFFCIPLKYLRLLFMPFHLKLEVKSLFFSFHERTNDIFPWQLKCCRRFWGQVEKGGRYI